MAFKVDPEAVQKAWADFLDNNPDQNTEQINTHETNPDANHGRTETVERSSPPRRETFQDKRDSFSSTKSRTDLHITDNVTDMIESKRDTISDDVSSFGDGEIWRHGETDAMREDRTYGLTHPDRDHRHAITKPEAGSSAIDHRSDNEVINFDGGEMITSRPTVSVRRGLSGKVRGLQRLERSEMSGRVARWFSSMFRWLPYSSDRTGYRFTLQSDAYSMEKSCQVVIYGEMAEGWLDNGAEVFVRGRRLSSGVVVARSVELLTEPPTEIRIRHQIAPLTVWFLSFLGLTFLFGLGTALYRFFSRFTSTINTIVDEHLSEIVVYLILLIIAISYLRRTFRRWRRRR